MGQNVNAQKDENSPYVVAVLKYVFIYIVNYLQV